MARETSIDMAALDRLLDAYDCTNAPGLSPWRVLYLGAAAAGLVLLPRWS